jgi:carnitine 3-dehydrogenase
MNAEGPKVIAVVGCGLIGVSWAALFASRGHAVRTFDVAPDWKSRVDGPLAAAKHQLHRLGYRENGAVSLSQTLEEAVRGADWVQENVTESLEAKREVFKGVCAAVRPDAVIASSTSSFTWTQLAPLIDLPERFITAHPFNPPHLMPLVEIYAPTEMLGISASGFYRDLGRRPILLRRDVTGHVANRLASALWREAVDIVANGIASVEDVDVAVTEGPGLRWSIVGPHMAYHLGGGPGGMRYYLEHLGESQVRRWADLGTPQLTDEVKQRLAEGVEREAAGRSIEELMRRRDALLMEALKLRGAASVTRMDAQRLEEPGNHVVGSDGRGELD